MSITAHNLDGYQVELSNGRHTIRADEPVSAGGDDTGPNPYDLLLGALAACKIITVQMYAQRKGWPLNAVTINMSTRRIHAEDCIDCDNNPDAKVDIIEVDISFEGDLDDEQLERLKQISERCPVHRTMTSETKIRTRLSVPSRD